MPRRSLFFPILTAGRSAWCAPSGSSSRTPCSTSATASDTQRLEKEFPNLPLYRVCGNCDREPVNPEVLQLTLDGVKFFLTHGHRYSVKYTLDALLNAAYFAGADIVLFGHTHRAVNETMQGLYVVNPGTAGVGAACTYARIETENGAIRTVGIHAIPGA